MRIKVQLDQESMQRARAMLHGREDRAKQLRPAFEAVAVDFLNLERRRFAGAAGWEPLSVDYALRKAASGKSPMPLAGGDLERSLTRAGTKYSTRRISKTSMFVGTRNPVANLHNKGTKRMPARPPVAVSSADTARWGRIFMEHLSGPAQRRLGL